MGRVGVKSEKALEFIEKLQQFNNINIEGIYTHFSSADSSEEYTKMQISKFNYVLEILKENEINIKYIHASNTAGIILYPEAHYNLVRPGIGVYGYYPDESMKDKISLKPSAKLKSKISFIKEVEENTSISYNQRFITTRKSKIATVPIGYADGIRRELSNKGNVYINGKYAKIVGSVCMDSFMVDVTDIESVNIGDEVIIFDNENITLEQIANNCNTISYEILSNIQNRVPREYA